MIAVKLAAVLFLLKCAFAQDEYAEYRGAPVDFDTKNIANGEYRYGFRTPDNIEREESGGFDSDGNYVVRGYYSYFDEVGKKVYVQYKADKDGYQIVMPPSQGTVISIPSFPGAASPGLPPAIVASLLG